MIVGRVRQTLPLKSSMSTACLGRITCTRSFADPLPSSPRISADLKEALQALSTVDEVTVEFATGTTVCRDDGSEAASVTFVTQHGDVPLLVADVSLLFDDNNGGVSPSFLRYEWAMFKVVLPNNHMLRRVVPSKVEADGTNAFISHARISGWFAFRACLLSIDRFSFGRNSSNVVGMPFPGSRQWQRFHSRASARNDGRRDLLQPRGEMETDGLIYYGRNSASKHSFEAYHRPTRTHHQ